MASTCLVVEDEPDIVTLIRMSLDPARYHVVTADSLAEARRALAAQHLVDAVILDVVLPDGDGLDLCRELKVSRPGVPVLVLTAWSTSRAEAAAAGADLFMEKPFDPDALAEALEGLLAGRRPPDGRLSAS